MSWPRRIWKWLTHSGFLLRGQIYDEPDIKTGEWKYTIEGHTPDGTLLAIVFCFKSEEPAFLITVFSVSSRGNR